MSESDTKKSEIDILFPEIEVEGYKIRPWTFGQLVDMSPIFRAIMAEAIKDGITFENIDKSVPSLVMIALPYAPDVISKTLEIDREEVRGWRELNKATVVLLTIITQNLEHIKNSSGLINQELAKIKPSG